jgi:hypothetical protein
MEYPEEARAGRVVDQGLKLLKKPRRDHRPAETVANRVRIGLGIGNVGNRIQHDVPPEGMAVGTVQIIQLLGAAKAACIGSPDPVPADGSAAAAIGVGKARVGCESMVPAPMRHQSCEEQGIFPQVCDKEAIFSRR